MLLGGCAAKEILAACTKHYSAQAVDTCRELILAEIRQVSTDLVTPDVDAAHTFYQVVFGWEYNIGGLEFGGYTTARS